jgi:hypothetical protein
LLVDDWEFVHSYQSVRRFVVKLRGESRFGDHLRGTALA